MASLITIDDKIKIIDILYDNKENIKEGDYLNICNILKKENTNIEYYYENFNRSYPENNYEADNISEYIINAVNNMSEIEYLIIMKEYGIKNTFDFLNNHLKNTLDDKIFYKKITTDILYQYFIDKICDIE